MNPNDQKRIMTESYRRAFPDQFEPAEWPESGEHPATDLDFMERLDADAVSAEERDAFLRHLCQCPFCRDEIAELLRSDVLYAEPDGVFSDSPQGEPAAAPRPKKRYATLVLTRVLTAAAALLLIVGVGVMPSVGVMFRSGMARRGLARVLTESDRAFSNRVSDYGYTLTGVRESFLKGMPDIGRHTDEVCAAYEKAIAADPEDPRLSLDYARYLHYVLDRADRARALLEKAVRTPAGAGNADVFLALGLAQFDLEDDDAAIGSFRRALEIDPDSFDARLNLAAALARSGHTAEALPLLEEAGQMPQAEPLRQQIDKALQTLSGTDGPEEEPSEGE